MNTPRHGFVAYIRTTPDELWEGITSPDFAVRYFHGVPGGVSGLRGVHPLGAYAVDSLRFAARVERKTR